MELRNFQGIYLSPQQAKALMALLQQNVAELRGRVRRDQARSARAGRTRSLMHRSARLRDASRAVGSDRDNLSPASSAWTQQLLLFALFFAGIDAAACAASAPSLFLG